MREHPSQHVWRIDSTCRAIDTGPRIPGEYYLDALPLDCPRDSPEYASTTRYAERIFWTGSLEELEASTGVPARVYVY